MKLLGRIGLLLAALWGLALFFGDMTTTGDPVYELVRAPESEETPPWMTSAVSFYRVKDETVVEKDGFGIERFDKCTVYDETNWKCTYDDGSGSFGMDDGDFWRKPEWHDFREVSRYEYVIMKKAHPVKSGCSISSGSAARGRALQRSLARRSGPADRGRVCRPNLGPNRLCRDRADLFSGKRFASQAEKQCAEGLS
ncbi:hypothetical protein [Rhodovibrio sodomensis]|uniref:hypothetical protein n=1 Tax=Rhodovibrio sodomensis TaxID=1088 RepID=UPI001902F1AD|nr:hypothetical protein [Rhodovibrio sodomensis]